MIILELGYYHLRLSYIQNVLHFLQNHADDQYIVTYQRITIIEHDLEDALLTLEGIRTILSSVECRWMLAIDNDKKMQMYK